jgi:phage terminase small subunit
MTDPVRKPLTEMEMLFAQIYVDNYFSQHNKSNTQCAVEAGYAKKSAYQRAHELLNPRVKPHVVMMIDQMIDEFKQTNGLTKDKHLSRLHTLGQKAEKKEMYGVAVNAEVQRGKVQGYYIEKKLIGQADRYEDMSMEELDAEMKKIEHDYELIAGVKKEDKDDKK